MVAYKISEEINTLKVKYFCSPLSYVLFMCIKEGLTILELTDLIAASLCVLKHEIIWNKEAFKLCLGDYTIK